jgi:hypothetical protein
MCIYRSNRNIAFDHYLYSLHSVRPTRMLLNFWANSRITQISWTSGFVETATSPNCKGYEPRISISSPHKRWEEDHAQASVAPIHPKTRRAADGFNSVLSCDFGRAFIVVGTNCPKESWSTGVMRKFNCADSLAKSEQLPNRGSAFSTAVSAARGCASIRLSADDKRLLQLITLVGCGSRFGSLSSHAVGWLQTIQRPIPRVMYAGTSEIAQPSGGNSRSTGVVSVPVNAQPIRGA